jgi:hypothetical protein
VAVQAVAEVVPEGEAELSEGGPDASREVILCKIRDVLRLKLEGGQTNRRIARSCHISRPSVAPADRERTPRKAMSQIA